MSIDFQFIRSTLERFEGKGITRGYVPCKGGVPLGASGVTIGTGVDLGQQTGAGLLDMGVPHPIVIKLLPYIGLKKQAAVDAIKCQALTLTAKEVAALDDAVIGRYVKNISQHYDKHNPKQPFAAIPSQAQAVIVSILYQRGLGFSGKAPVLWRAFLMGDWKTAAAWLCDPANGGGYHSRRKAEGEILKTIKPKPKTWADEVAARAGKKQEFDHGRQ